MMENSAEQGLKIRSVMLWQTGSVVTASILLNLFYSSWMSVLFGGMAVVVSTWHVFKSVYASGGDRTQLLKSAGVRFALFLLILAVGIYVLSLQPVFVIVGMTVAYITLYVRSLLVTMNNMKGDGLG